MEEQNRQQAQFINELQDKTSILEKELMKLLKSQARRSQEFQQQEETEKNRMLSEISELKRQLDSVNELNRRLVEDTQKMDGTDAAIQTDDPEQDHQVPEATIQCTEDSTQTEQHQSASTDRVLPSLFTVQGCYECVAYGLHIQSVDQELAISKSIWC
jgi:DNA repair exonuclease SbcCD ATPase subunit